MKQLAIYDKDSSGILDVDLSQIILKVESFYPDIEWMATELYIVLNKGSQFNALDLERECENQYKQYKQHELLVLLSNLFQLIDGTFIGVINNGSSIVEVIRVIFIDSSLVTVTSENENLLNVIKDMFSNYECE
jgi:hypothetical protein